jgi:hypothetical protein
MKKSLTLSFVLVVSLAIGFTLGWFLKGQRAENESRQVMLSNTISRAVVAAWCLRSMPDGDNSDLRKRLEFELKSGLEYADHLTRQGVRLPVESPRLVAGMSDVQQYVSAKQMTQLVSMSNAIVQVISPSTTSHL